MVDIVLDVGLQVTPESVRNIRRQVETAFRQLEPEVQVDIGGIQRQLENAEVNLGSLGVTPEALRNIQNEVRRRVTIEFDKVELARSALEKIKREVENRTRIALEAAGRLRQTRQAAAGIGFGGVQATQEEVEQANRAAATAARRLAAVQTQLIIAEREFERVVEQQTNRRRNASRDVDRLSREFNNNQRSLNAAVSRAAETRRREAEQQASQEARRLRQEFNRNQQRLNRSLRAAATQRDREARENGRLLARSINVEEARQREIRRFLSQIQGSISATADVEATERQLNTALRRRIAEERRSGRIRGGAGAPSVGGLSDVTALAPNLNTREFERLKLVLAQTSSEARRLSGQTLGLGGRVRNLDSEARRLNQTLRRTDRGFRRGGRAAQGFTARVARATQTVLAFAGPTALIFGTINQLERAAQTIAEIDTAARRLVFFQEAGPFLASSQAAESFNISLDRVNSTTSDLLQLSARTGVAVERLADAFVTITRIGQSADSQFAKTVVSLLRVEGAALNAEQATRLLNAIQIQFLRTLEDFDAGIADAAINNIGNLIETTAAQSAFNVEQLSNALTRIGPALTAVQGTNIAQAIALIGEAANATGADVGRLSTTFRQLTTFVVQNAEQIRESTGGDIQILDPDTGQIRSFEAILDFLQRIRELSASGSGEAVSLALQGADRRNVSSVLALARNVDELRKKYEEAGDESKRLERAQKDAIEVFEAEQTQAESLSGTVERLSATFTAFLNEPAVKNFLLDVLERTIELIQFAGAAASAIGDLGREFNGLGGAIDLSVGGVASEVDDTGNAFNNVLGVLSPILGILKELSDFQRDINENTNALTEEEEKQLRAINARKAEARLIAAETEQERIKAGERLAIANALRGTQTAIRNIAAQLANEELSATRRTQLRLELERLINQQKRLGGPLAKDVAESERRSAFLAADIVQRRREEERRLRNISSLQKIVSQFLTGREAIDFQFRVDQRSVQREIDLIDRQIAQLEANLGEINDDDAAARLAVEDKISDLREKRLEQEDRLQTNILNRQSQIVQEAFDRAEDQIRAWESASDSVVEAFRGALDAQKSIADLFGQQGDIVLARISRESSAISQFLSVTGANIDDRLREASSQAARQISEIRRTGAAQLRAFREGAALDPFIDIEDVQVQTNRLLNLITTSVQRVATEAESERERQIRETENEVNRIRVANAQAEFQLRIDRTRSELEIRRQILDQEIAATQENLRVERELNELRRAQQEQFGRLLVESPEKFRDTINDIATATRFFRGVTDINIGGLRTISRRIQELRGEGQVEALQSVLRGLQAASRFGRQVAPGVGAAQLRSVFERLQLNLPEDVNADLKAQRKEAESQSELQRRIEQRERIQQQLIQFDIALQEAQLRLQSANAEIARGQRDQIIDKLDLQIASFFDATTELGVALGTTFERLFARNIGAASIFRTGIRNAQRRAQEITESAGTDTSEETERFNRALAQSSSLLERGRPGAPGVRGGAGTLSEVNAGIGAGVTGGNILQQVAGEAFNRISQSLRPIAGGRLRIISPELETKLEQLRSIVETTGGTRAQRNELRRLEAQARNSIGGGVGSQSREAARRLFRGETATEITEGFRALLQDRGGRDNQFVQQLRELRAQRNVDPEATRRLLSAQGLGGLAEGATTSRRAANVIDRLLRLSDDLSENQQRLTRDAGREIKRILSDEIAQGIRDLNEAVKETREAARREGREVTRNEALTNALQNFSIASPEQLDRLNTTIKSAFEDVSNEVTDKLREVTEDAAATLRGTTLELKIPADQEITTVLQVDVGRAINSEQFARQIAEQLSETLGGTIDPAVIDRISRQIIRITEPLIKAGIITASPSDLGTGE